MPDEMNTDLRKAARESVAELDAMRGKLEAFLNDFKSKPLPVPPEKVAPVDVESILRRRKP